MPGTVVSVWYTFMNKIDKDPCPHGAYILVWGLCQECVSP